MAAIFRIGRDASVSDIVVGGDGNNVSRVHAELRDDGGRFTLIDLQSSNGTEVLEGDQWKRIGRAEVVPETRVRFARQHDMTVQDLLRAGIEEQARRAPEAAKQSVVAQAQPAREPTIKAGGAALANAPAPAATGSYTKLVCGRCGSKVSGRVCTQCGTPHAGEQDGLINIIAQDAYAFGNRGGLLPVIYRLLRNPVSATVGYANDASFNLHWPLFGLGILIYVGLAEAIDANLPGGKQLLDNSVLYKALGDLFPPLRLLPQKVVFFGTIYAMFLFTFVISYSVFRDYSRRPRSARSYLRFCCISSFVNQVVTTALLLPIAAVAIGMITDPVNFQKVFMPTFLAVLIFVLQYVLRAVTKFWDISLVSAFRGLVTALVLAIVALFLLFFGLAMINVTVRLWSGTPI